MSKLPQFSSERFFAVLLVAAVAFSYFWVALPGLSKYSLQLFALCLAGFFVLRRLSGARLHHLLPGQLSFDLLLITIGFLVFIGATGAIGSPFFPLSFLYLFALVFSSSARVSIPVMGAVLLFFYALTPALTWSQLPSLLSIPLLLILFLLGKSQYQQSQTTQVLLEQESETLTIVSHTASTLEAFLSSFMLPKLDSLENLSKRNSATLQELSSQISLLKSEVEKLLKRAST